MSLADRNVMTDFDRLFRRIMSFYFDRLSDIEMELFEMKDFDRLLGKFRIQFGQIDRHSVKSWLVSLMDGRFV